MTAFCIVRKRPKLIRDSYQQPLSALPSFYFHDSQSRERLKIFSGYAIRSLMSKQVHDCDIQLAIYTPINSAYVKILLGVSSIKKRTSYHEHYILALMSTLLVTVRKLFSNNIPYQSTRAVEIKWKNKIC